MITEQTKIKLKCDMKKCLYNIRRQCSSLGYVEILKNGTCLGLYHKANIWSRRKYTKIKGEPNDR